MFFAFTRLSSAHCCVQNIDDDGLVAAKGAWRLSGTAVRCNDWMHSGTAPLVSIEGLFASTIAKLHIAPSACRYITEATVGP